MQVVPRLAAVRDRLIGADRVARTRVVLPPHGPGEGTVVKGLMLQPRTLAAIAALAASLALSACGGGQYRPVSDTPVRIGRPYTVRGVTYAPAAQPDYDMLGYATWYGSESGNRVANGEKFRPKWITGAHTTLPLPSYVEVTALDTGRRILVRVNDRGPFSREGRVIDLSRGAAALLGIQAKGKAAVRVRVADPSQADRAQLRKGKPAKDLAPLPPGVLAELRRRFVGGVGPL